MDLLVICENPSVAKPPKTIKINPKINKISPRRLPVSGSSERPLAGVGVAVALAPDAALVGVGVEVGLAAPAPAIVKVDFGATAAQSVKRLVESGLME